MEVRGQAVEDQTGRVIMKGVEEIENGGESYTPRGLEAKKSLDLSKKFKT